MPVGSMLKYFSDRGGDDHGGHLHWPGTTQGFPYRGEVAPTLRQSEMDAIQHALDYKSRSFKMWEPQDKAAFDLVMDRIVNGWYLQHKRFDNYVESQQDYVIRLEWVQIYGEHPSGKTPGSRDAYSQTINLAPSNATPGLDSQPADRPTRHAIG